MLNLIADITPEGEENVNNERISAQVLQELYSLIENLPPEQRKVFKLIYLKKKSSSEIADILGISTQMVLYRETQAIHQLRAEIFKKKSESDQ